MGAVSAQGRATATRVTVISESDLQLGIAEIKGTTAVMMWMRHGKPVDDIETEVPNVINNLVYRGNYIKLRNRICSTHKIDEREFVRQLFQRMTRR